MDFNKRDPSTWDQCKLMELMNDKELDDFMEWQLDPDARDDADLFGVDTWQKKALEILKNALKREMLDDNVNWDRVYGYVTACPTLCGEKWDEDAKDDETTALYHALKNHAPLKVITAIVEGFPSALHIREQKSRNDDRLLHLHVAINEGAAVDMLSLLLLAGSEHAISVRDKDGNTPLHCACKVKADPAVMKFLHHKYPQATNIQNNDGYLPRDYAFESNQSRDVIMWMYEKWPEMETIDISTSDDDDERAHYRVLSNDPSLKHLSLDCKCPLYSEKEEKYHSVLDDLHCQNYLRQLTIAIYPDWGHCSSDGSRRSHLFMQALARNTSITHLVVEVMDMHEFGIDFGAALSDTLVLPSLERLSIQPSWNEEVVPEEVMTALKDVLQHDSKVKTFEMEMFSMNNERAVLFAESFRQNKTIKHLRLHRHTFSGARSALVFVRDLPENHCLESIHFNGETTTWYNERDQMPNIIEVLGHTRLKSISVTGIDIKEEIFRQIMDTLKRISHHFTKVDIVYPDEWKREIQKETYANHESFIRKNWMNNYFKEIPRTPTKHDLFITIMRAKREDDEQPFSTPNILYTLMKGMATNIEHMRTISDAFQSQYGKKRGESYFFIDSRGERRKRVCYTDD